MLVGWLVFVGLVVGLFCFVFLLPCFSLKGTDLGGEAENFVWIFLKIRIALMLLAAVCSLDCLEASGRIPRS